jgi:hypothetical protein
MREESSNGVVLTVTASAVVSDRNCVVTAISLNPAAAACTVSLYDPLPVIQAPGITAAAQTTVGATLRLTLSAPASVASPCLPLPSGVEFANGCLAVVTGAGATACVAFAKI